MDPVTIPKWIPPFPTAGVLNRQDSLPTTKINNVASGRPPRLVYGPQWVGGRIFARPAYNAGVWTVGYMVGVGEMEAIDIVHLNGALPPVGVSVNTYTGTTSQAVDPLLSSAIGGYSDSLVLSDERGQLGFANVVIQYSNDDFPAPPTVLAKVRGRKVWDPATQTTIYSQNPALIVADLIRDPWMGLGEPVDDASLIAAASACSDSVITESRRLLGITIESQQETMALIETLRVYAACWPNKRGDTWVFEPDRPAATAMTISASDMVRGSFRVGLVDEAQVPTVIKVIYTDTSSSEWHEREICYPDSIAGARRESLVRLPGVHRYSQARREAKERWNRLQRTQSLTFTGHDHTGRLERGDIIAVTHPMGLSGELFRLTEQPSQSTPGRFQIQAVEYHASDYDDSEDVDPGSTGSSGVVGELLPFGGSGSITIFRQNDAPTANAVNDLWVELDTDQVWQWNGSAWVIFANSFDDTSQLVDSAGLGASAIWASITGTGKPDDDATQNQIFRQASQPTGTEDDLWYETDTGLWYQYTAGAWQVAANSFDATSDLTDDAGLGDTANWSQIVDNDGNKPDNNATQNTIYHQASAPSSPINGDMWHETDTDIWWTRVGGVWQESATIGAEAGVNFTPKYSVGSNTLLTSAAETANIGTTYTKVKEFTLAGLGSFKFQFDISNSDPASPVGSTSTLEARQGATVIGTVTTGAPGTGYTNGVSFNCTLINATNVAIYLKHNNASFNCKIRNAEIQIGLYDSGEAVVL